MARTLTAGAITWKVGPTYQYSWLVESEMLNIRWAFNDPGWGGAAPGGYTWEARLRSISEIELNVPPGGGLAAVQTVTITIFESTTGNSLRNMTNNGKVLQGADLVVSLLPLNEAYADRIKVFTGKIDQASWTTGSDGGVGTVIAVDQSLHPDLQLPQTIATTLNFPNLPDHEGGSLLPILYGRDLSTTDISVPLLMTDKTNLIYRAADHEIATISTSHRIVPPDRSRKIVQTGNTATVDLALAQLTLSKPITDTTYRPEGTSPTHTVSRQTNVTNANNAIDNNTGTVAEIGTGTTNADGDGEGILGVKRDWSSPLGINLVQIDLQAHRRKTGGATTTTGQLVVRIIDATTDAIIRDDLFHSEIYRHVSNARTHVHKVASLELGKGTTIEAALVVLNEGGAGGANDAWQIGEIVIDGFYQPSSMFERIYSNTLWQGRKDDIAGTITGTANTTIWKAADVLRSLLSLLQIPIDTASFTTARTLTQYAGGSYQFTFGLGSGGWFHERIAGSQLLDDLALQAKSYLFPGGDGNAKLVPYPDSPSSQFAFTSAHVDRVDVELSRPELIRNAIEVHYQWDPAFQRFKGNAYADRGSSNHENLTKRQQLIDKCATSAAQYGVREPLVIEAYGIAERVVADTLLEHLVNYFWSQLAIVTFEAVFVGIHLEVGDFVTLTDNELPTDLDGQLLEIVRVTLVPEEPERRPMPIRLRAVRSVLAAGRAPGRRALFAQPRRRMRQGPVPVASMVGVRPEQHRRHQRVVL